MDYIYLDEAQFYQDQLENFLLVAEKLRIEGLKTEEPETKPEPHFEESSPAGTDYTEIKVKTSHASPGYCEKIVSFTEMAEVEEKIQQLMERREHVELYIDDLSYPCRFCGKIFRYTYSLPRH